MKELFSRFARKIATITGSPSAFIIATLVIIVWAVSGPIFHFSDTWQLVINTSTTIVTFLMVFLIQNSQNRESVATQIKLDELIRAVERARNGMIDIEEASQEQLEQLQERFRRQAQTAEASGDIDAADVHQQVAATLGSARTEADVSAHKRTGRRGSENKNGRYVNRGT